MTRQNEVISENATRSIFGWLRFDGHAPHEKAIWDHEWFAMSDSDEDDGGFRNETPPDDSSVFTPGSQTSSP